MFCWLVQCPGVFFYSLVPHYYFSLSRQLSCQHRGISLAGAFTQLQPHNHPRQLSSINFDINLIGSTTLLLVSSPLVLERAPNSMHSPTSIGYLLTKPKRPVVSRRSQDRNLKHESRIQGQESEPTLLVCYSESTHLTYLLK